mgnify:CR=1 FL=1
MDEDNTQLLASAQDLYNAGVILDVDSPLENLNFLLTVDNENISIEWDGEVSSNPAVVPDPDYFGAAMLTLCISDEENETCGSNNLTVNPVDDAPTASDQSATDNEDAAQTITLAGSDAEGDALTYALATNPSNGTATLSERVSLDFDGNNDYVSIPRPVQDDFSLSFWVNTTNDGSTHNNSQWYHGHGLVDMEVGLSLIHI